MTKLPDKLFGREVKGSLERVLREPESNLVRPVIPVNVPNLDGYIYVPSTQIYVAKERSHFNENWSQSHESLEKEDSFMMNPYEFVEFLKFLRENRNNENNKIFEKITKVQSPYRGEWLDAKFQPNEIVYHKIDPNGNYILAEEPLQPCLMTTKTSGIDLDYWINNHNIQGLPYENNPDGSLYYWKPTHNRVAWFVAGSGWAWLICDGNPSNTSPGLGVRAAKIKV